MEKTLIKLENVSLKYPLSSNKNKSFLSLIKSALLGKKESDGVIDSKNILSNISLDITKGDRVAILGHNGAGKTTLLRVMAGIYEPSEGEFIKVGQVSSLISISLGIHEDVSGIDNIYLRARLMGRSKEAVKSKIKDIIEFSELGHHIEQPVRTYSSGMKMRLAFSIATAFKIDILLMDEWLSVGDKEFKIKAQNKLTELVYESNIVVLASHSESLVRKVCNKAMILEHGQVKNFGPIKEISDIYFKG
ncbi:ABC transporter ATP-binding protein [Thorsellia anophelis]|uniref:Lipopolysaccharide transport system ATP-binding protein n=1 Tax=Thorsellia anophelis DSM 18579 TaxID=1123402 RepID=A0A1I0DXN9_9GAMM|nr:ABC transporter ATP-binding protein [Thorsellia anophelis]SET37476.1 lipopolysaccharide transport system ATP-binding protein [Thorsellia anophelis DSM 18579]